MLPPNITPFDNPNAITTQAIDELPAIPDEIIEENPVDRIAAMFERSKGLDRAKVRVESMEKDGSIAFCADYPPDQFEDGDLQMIREQFGPGKYTLTLYAVNPETKRYGRYRRVQVVVKPASELFRVNAAPVVPETKSMQDQLREMLSLAVMMREAFGMNQAPAPAPAPVPLASQLSELITVMKGAREIAAEVNPPPESEDPLMRLASQAIPMISQALQDRATASQPAVSYPLQPVQLPPTLAAPEPPRVTSQATPHGDDMEPADIKELRNAINSINLFARVDADAEGTAQLIYEKIPDDARPILESANWFAQICQIAPACAPFQPWYQKVRDHLLKFWREDDADEANDTATGAAA
jgi:hypothetical protein